jgi:hypothetical protein
MPELEITPRSGGYAIEVKPTREFFGYGRNVLLTEEAQVELVKYLYEKQRDMIMGVVGVICGDDCNGECSGEIDGIPKCSKELKKI